MPTLTHDEGNSTEDDIEVCPLPAIGCPRKFVRNEPEKDIMFKFCRLPEGSNFIYLEHDSSRMASTFFTHMSF